MVRCEKHVQSVRDTIAEYHSCAVIFRKRPHAVKHRDAGHSPIIQGQHSATVQSAVFQQTTAILLDVSVVHHESTDDCENSESSPVRVKVHRFLHYITFPPLKSALFQICSRASFFPGLYFNH